MFARKSISYQRNLAFRVRSVSHEERQINKQKNGKFKRSLTEVNLREELSAQRVFLVVRLRFRILFFSLSSVASFARSFTHRKLTRACDGFIDTIRLECFPLSSAPLLPPSPCPIFLLSTRSDQVRKALAISSKREHSEEDKRNCNGALTSYRVWG